MQTAKPGGMGEFMLKLLSVCIDGVELTVCNESRAWLNQLNKVGGMMCLVATPARPRFAEQTAQGP